MTNVQLFAGKTGGDRKAKSSRVDRNFAFPYLLVQHWLTDKSAKFQPLMQMHLKDAPLDPSVFLPVFIRIVGRFGRCFAITFG